MRLLATTAGVPASPISMACFRRPYHHICVFSSPFYAYPRNMCCSFSITNSRKGAGELDLNVEQTTVEQALEEDDTLLDDTEGPFMDNDDFEDDSSSEAAKLFVGDGGAGGGISLAGTWWDKKAFSIAENHSLLLERNLKIYAFKTLPNVTIQVRIETMTNRSGSPSMIDLNDFSVAYKAQLDEAAIAGFIPHEFALEVSSPGVERVVHIPEDLHRFQERAMYVKYRDHDGVERDGVLQIMGFDEEKRWCNWGIADVRINREKAGKGRPLNKNQREWRGYLFGVQ